MTSELLFSPYALGAVELPNRIAMAPMTRSRATNPDRVERLRARVPQARWNAKTFYTAGAEGYTDYPPLPAEQPVPQ